jgi:bifunctional UDP-N-acetylglucosamine pyrophosphorylase/glucosamine-1-phosphate N-acetyltransferase
MDAQQGVAAVILAAGYGTRMKSTLPKVLHPVAGRPMIDWCVRAAQAASERRPLVVVGHGREQVIQTLGARCEFVEQSQLLGTAHALQQAAPLLWPMRVTGGRGPRAVLVTYGDMPQLRAETLQALVARFAAEQTASAAAFAMLTIVRDDPQGFGRVVRNESGAIQAIVEEVDCTPEQRGIRELNVGIYCFDGDWLRDNLFRVERSRKGEFYLTDLVALAAQQGRPVVTIPAPADEVDGINTRVHLAQAEAVLRRRIAERLMLAGVTIVDPATTYIDESVAVGADTVILPGTFLLGATQIGAGARIGPHSQIVDSSIGDRCMVSWSVVEQARMEAGSEVGPFGHLRKGAHLGPGVHMGNFGEVKNSYLGSGSKMGHFSYIGDAQIGENVNIGAGTITCNFDGAHKHKTTIGNDVFIGSDTMLVAPLTIGEGARTGAGSVVTHDVPAQGLVYGVPARAPGGQGTQPAEDASAADDEPWALSKR